MNVKWNKPPYISSHISNDAIFKLLYHTITENNSIRIATRLNNIDLSRLKVTALTKNKRVLVTKSITFFWNRTR